MNASVKKKKVVHRDFAQRMEQASEANPHVPPVNYGRLGWVAEQLEAKFGNKVTIESVRRWFAGEARPRIETLHQLAEVFGVDEAWLAIGSAPDLHTKDKRLRRAEVNGAVNVVTGIIQMSGGHPAYPEDEQESANTDLFAIIRGAQYELKVVVGQPVEDKLKFIVPSGLDRQIVIGMEVNDDHQFNFYEIEPDVIAGAKRHGGYYEVVASPDDLRKINTFGERL